MRFSCFCIRFLIGASQNIAMTTSTRTCRMRTTPMQLLHLQFPPNHHSASSSPSPLANKSHAPPQKSQNSISAWDMCKTVCLAGGAGLEQVIAAADDAMPQAGLPEASERAGGDGRRAGLKRKAWKITRSAAVDFALLTTRTSSMRYAADFLSTVGNVSFSYIYLKQSNYF